ncbi:MAG: response regulator transcription factor, partial [Bacteroidota bacterium]
MIKVALADDHEIVRDGIKMLLEQDNEISVIWEASDGQDTIEKVSEEKPDVLVADIRMPICNGLEVVQKLKAQDASVKIIMLTMHNDSEYILKSMQYGADGYLLKDTSKTEFHKAIKLVHQNQKYFSGDISTTIVDSLLNNNSTSDFDAGKPSLAKEDYQL